jgi:hypothetical protein
VKDPNFREFRKLTEKIYRIGESNPEAAKQLKAEIEPLMFSIQVNHPDIEAVHEGAERRMNFSAAKRGLLLLFGVLSVTAWGIVAADYLSYIDGKKRYFLCDVTRLFGKFVEFVKNAIPDDITAFFAAAGIGTLTLAISMTVWALRVDKNFNTARFVRDVTPAPDSGDSGAAAK